MLAGLVSTKSAAQWMGPDLFEYSLIALPDTGAVKRIREQREEFGREFNTGVGYHAKPHLLVARFTAREPMEETFSKWIHRICMLQHAFMITLNNYSGFSPHTIYLRVQDPAPILRVGAQLKVIDSFLESSGCSPVKLVTKPYLSIARQLAEETYARAIRAYSQRIFHDSFMVEELQLLRRAYPSDPCKTISVFRLPPAANS